jgi:dienelactone hydrolase
VYIPSLFGTDGAEPSAEDGVKIFRRACVSAEFRALGGGASSPVTTWLRALARLAHAESGGEGVGAIGMCFTGNFALTMMLEPSMLAPVVCQPSLPLDDPAGLEISTSELFAIAERLARDDLTVLGYRFAGDRYCRAQRFAAYRQALGERFEERVLPDNAAKLSEAPPFHASHVNFPHSVVTVHLVDEEGSPTLAARDEIVRFLRVRLERSQ